MRFYSYRCRIIIEQRKRGVQLVYVYLEEISELINELNISNMNSDNKMTDNLLNELHKSIPIFTPEKVSAPYRSLILLTIISEIIIEKIQHLQGELEEEVIKQKLSFFQKNLYNFSLNGMDSLIQNEVDERDWFNRFNKELQTLKDNWKTFTTIIDENVFPQKHKSDNFFH